MSRLPYRGSIVRVAFVVALFASRPAFAQIGADPGPYQEPGGLLNNLATGAQYDIVNQAKAERRLQHFQAKLDRDAERGHSAAVDRDARRIYSLRYRIVVDEWLIRENTGKNPGYYPYPFRMDPITCAAIANAARPPDAPPILPPSSGRTGGHR